MDTSFICIESTVTIRAGAAAVALEALKAYASPPVRSVLSSLINPLMSPANPIFDGSEAANRAATYGARHTLRK